MLCFVSVMIGVLFLRKKEQIVEENLGTARLMASAVGKEMKNNMLTPVTLSLFMKEMRKAGSVQQIEKDGQQGYFIDEEYYNNIVHLQDSIEQTSKKNRSTLNIFLSAINDVTTKVELAEFKMKEVLEDVLDDFFLKGQKKMITQLGYL